MSVSLWEYSWFLTLRHQATGGRFLVSFFHMLGGGLYRWEHARLSEGTRGETQTQDVRSEDCGGQGSSRSVIWWFRLARLCAFVWSLFLSCACGWIWYLQKIPLFRSGRYSRPANIFTGDRSSNRANSAIRCFWTEIILIGCLLFILR